MILYETLMQGTMLLVLIVGGFLCGFLFDAVKLVSKNKQVIKNILGFFVSIVSYLVLFLIVLSFGFGQMRLWHILVFVASVALQRASCGLLLAKFLAVCYNFFHKKIKKGNKIEITPRKD